MRFLALAVLLVLGCSSAPAEGVTCSPPGGIACQSQSQALFCEQPGPRFRLFNCPGVQGCLSDGTRALCDFHGSAENAPCPDSQVSKAFCSGGRFFRCTSNLLGGATWQSMACASSCTEDTSGTVTCR
jgi:hypothetical protein